MDALAVFNNVTLSVNGQPVFKNTNWIIRPGEHWVLLGPNGSGKSLLTQSLLGRLTTLSGEVAYTFRDDKGRDLDLDPCDAIACVSAQSQREMIRNESSFYQSRWHSGIQEGENTVARFLSYSLIQEINPYEVGKRKKTPSHFLEYRRELINALDLKPLWRRKILFLSNGEQRKVLLAHCLLHFPQILILDDPYAGLDASMRGHLAALIKQLLKKSMPVILVTNRIEEIPPGMTHALLIQDHKIVHQGAFDVALKKYTLQNIRPPSPTRDFSSNKPHDKQSSSSSMTSKKADSGNSPHQEHSAKGRHRMQSDVILEMKDISIKRGRTFLLKNIEWSVRQNENWAIMGPNGAGKTTLLSLVLGDHPQVYASGARLFGRNLNDSQELWQLRRLIGFVSPELHQHYPLEWTCQQVVCSGFFQSIGLHQAATARQRACALDWLDYFGLATKCQSLLGEISTGEQRLVLLARAMVNKPRLLILDEPCQGLDGIHRHSILSAVDRIFSQTGIPILFVTHHPDELPNCITHILRMRQGKIIHRARIQSN